MGLFVIPQDFCGSVTRIVIAGHYKTIGARIVKYQNIAFIDLINAAVAGKGIGLTNIAHYGVEPGFTIWI